MKSKLVVGIVLKFSSLVIATQLFLPGISQGQTLSATAPISIERQTARTMFIRLTGVIPAIDSVVLDQMEAKIKAGDKVGAANIAIADPNFLDIVVRNMATTMSNVAEQVTDDLSDFVATVVGVTRDSLNAKELLTGNYIYTSNAAGLPIDMVNDILKSNNHYAALSRMNSFASTLVKTVQQIVDPNGLAVPHPETAGLLTSRKFGLEHLTAGTNRRAVRYTFREFLCRDIQEFADPAGPDNMISQDVDRFPAGDNAKFQAECRSCHTMLDGMRPAFAHFDFSDNYVKNTPVLANGTAANQINLNPTTGLVAKSYIHADVFPAGNILQNTNWVNNATRNSTNANYFGWRGNTSGTGLQSFATMVANSQSYSQCFTKRVIRSVCNRNVTGADDGLVTTLANYFESANYNIKALFSAVAVQPDCLGE